MKPWWQDEEFWVSTAPLMFDPDRLEDTPGDLEQILHMLNLPPGAAVYDSCCGKGRHARILAEKGFTVTGVDLCGPYIREARSLGGSKTRLELIEGDVISFRRENAFDAALNLFTSFGYFEEDQIEAYLANVYASLKPGGRFLIETEGKESFCLNYKEREWFERDGMTIMVEQKPLLNWTAVEKRWIYYHHQRQEWQEHRLEHRLFSALELGQLLGEAGFSEVSFFGGLDGREYDQTARTMVAVALKKS